jgi:hypothetical protein
LRDIEETAIYLCWKRNRKLSLLLQNNFANKLVSQLRDRFFGQVVSSLINMKEFREGSYWWYWRSMDWTRIRTSNFTRQNGFTSIQCWCLGYPEESYYITPTEGKLWNPDCSWAASFAILELVVGFSQFQIKTQKQWSLR